MSNASSTSSANVAVSTAELLRTADYWTIRGANIVALVNEPGSRRNNAHVVSVKELEKAHPLLPKALRATIKHADKRYVVYGDGATELRSFVVHALLRVLHGGYFVLTDVNRQTHRVLELHTMGVQHDVARVSMSAQCALTGTAQLDGEPIVFVRDVMRLNLEIAFSELEQMAPGWEHRMNVGVGVGIRGRELIDYMFTPLPATGVDQPQEDVKLPSFD